jgi:aminotransferase
MTAMPRVSARATNLILPPFDVLNQKAATLRAAGHDVISLGQAVPGFGPPPAAVDAARRALDMAGTHRYSADAGILSLREALCEQLSAHRHIRASPEDVIITAGGNQAFMLAAMTLIDPGAEVVLATPYFVNHEMAIRAIGGVPIEAPLNEADGFSIRWPAIEPHIDRPELARIVHELSARGVTVFSDETYLHFVPDAHGPIDPASAASLDEWRDNVVVIGTFSKSFGMTGWRAGYMLADRGVCEQAIKIQDAMIICAPMISQIAVEAAVRSDWNYAHAFHGELLTRREALGAGIRRIPQFHWTPTAGGFFAFVRVDGCDDSIALASDIVERVHVVTIPGATFGSSGEGFLRLSYGATSAEQITEACDRLRNYFP